MRRVGRWCGLLAGALVTALAWWHWRVAAPIVVSSLALSNYDLYSYYYPTVRFGFAELLRAHLPLWNPYQLAGEPFFATQQHGLLYPINLPFALLAPAQAFQCAAIVHYVLALVFTGYLARLLGLSTGAGIIAAVTFAFGGYLPDLLYYRTWLAGAVWLPLELALVIRIFRDPSVVRPTVLLAVAFALQYLGGYPMYNLFSAYCLALFALWESVRLARGGDWWILLRSNSALGVAAIAAAGLAAVQFLPMAEMTWLSPRRLGGLALSAIFTPNMAYALPRLVLPLTTPLEGSAYLGAAIVPLVIASLFHRRLRSIALFFVTLAALALAIFVGPATPLAALYLRLPASHWFRFPAQIEYLAFFGLALAAGIGADRLAGGTPRAGMVKWVGPALLALALGLVVRVQPLPSPFAWAGRTTSVLLLAPALVVLLVATRSRKAWWAVVLTAVWVDLSLSFANVFVLPDFAPDRFAPPPALLQFLRTHQGRQRTYMSAQPGQPPLAKTGMLYGVASVTDHESLLPWRYAEYAAYLARGSAPPSFAPPQGELLLDPQRKQLKLLDLLGVRFIVANGPVPFAATSEAAQYAEVFRADGYHVYENPRALPRAFIVGTAEVADSRSILPRLAEAAFDPLRTALVEDPAASFADGANGTADITAYEPEEIVVHTLASAPGLLIVTDQFYPGWHATIDAEPAPIYCADYIFRGVRLPAGEHTVVFRYAPRSFRLGAAISAIVLAMMLLCAWRFRG